MIANAKCKYLSISAEAYSSQNGRDLEPMAGYLCTWAVGRHPIAPVWFDKLNGGGHMIDPAVNCVECPCFEKGERQNLGETAP